MADITGAGIPNEFTFGNSGDIYTDSITRHRFKCISVITILNSNKKYYFWAPIIENNGGGIPEGYTIATDEEVKELFDVNSEIPPGYSIAEDREVRELFS